MARSKMRRKPAAFGRGTGVPHPVDVHVGKRIRLQRLLLGMNQDTLGKALGLAFQQVQKYEKGANRVSASRLAEMATVLGVPIPFFFSGLSAPNDTEDRQWQEWTEHGETIELIRCYHAIPDYGVRQQFLDLIRTIAGALTDPRKPGEEASHLRQPRAPRRTRRR